MNTLTIIIHDDEGVSISSSQNLREAFQRKNFWICMYSTCEFTKKTIASLLNGSNFTGVIVYYVGKGYNRKRTFPSFTISQGKVIDLEEIYLLVRKAKKPLQYIIVGADTSNVPEDKSNGYDFDIQEGAEKRGIIFCSASKGQIAYEGEFTNYLAHCLQNYKTWTEVLSNVDILMHTQYGQNCCYHTKGEKPITL